MYTVELYARVRRAVLVEGKSRRWVAREFGLARKTIGKMLAFSLPPGYRRQQPIRRPKLGPWLGVIDAILEDDKQRPRKQRHTAKRIFDRLRAEHGYPGGYTIVKDHVRLRRLRGQEMFVPLTHAAGTAQVDFGEAQVIVGGVESKAHYFAMDLPQSDDIFVMTFPAETTEAFLEGHVQAFAYFEGVPISILYDNTKLAVARILGDGERQKTRAFSELQSHYLFGEKFGRVGKGSDKGNVEGLVGYARRNFLVPIPRANSWEELNAYLREECRKHRQHRVRGHEETIGERFEHDRSALLALPPVAYEACEKFTTKVNSYSLVRYRTNDYSVPTHYGYRDVLVKGYVHQVVIACSSEVIARHPRSYEHEDIVFEPRHYLALLEQKPRALDQAAPLANWELPACFAQLRRLLEARLSKGGKREYIQVLRLLETFSLQQVTLAIEDALRLGTISFDAVRHLLLCRIEHRPPRLDLANWPHLPAAHVRTTQAADYLALLSGSPTAPLLANPEVAQ
ncbi:MAG TPA: IS21 family transposase [Candidatus Methylomirabilis sp.]|nr:IS21 family transposase [Candidatus Methylomirabilis sp.]